MSELKPKNDYQLKTMALSTYEKIGFLVEECGEVLAAAGKSVRWGLYSVNPELPEQEQEANADWLKRELADLRFAIDVVERELI